MDKSNNLKNYKLNLRYILLIQEILIFFKANDSSDGNILFINGNSENNNGNSKNNNGNSKNNNGNSENNNGNSKINNNLLHLGDAEIYYKIRKSYNTGIIFR